MNYETVLTKLENNEISVKDAYNKVYNPNIIKPGKRATFVKMRIRVPEEGKGVNMFLRILFAIPIPIIFARWGLKFAERFVKDEDVDFKIISKMIKYSKNTLIQVESKDAKIDIKVI